MNRGEQAKDKMRSWVLKLAKDPRVGHLVEVAIAVWRGPETRFAVIGQQPSEAPVPSASRPPRAPHEDDVENLVASVPVTLRKLRRELEELKQRTRAQETEIAQLRAELRARGG